MLFPKYTTELDEWKHLNWKLSSTTDSCQHCIHTCFNEIQIFSSLLHTLKISQFSQTFEEWMPRYFSLHLSLSMLHFMANAISKPLENISCLYQYCSIVSVHMLLLYDSHTRFHTKIKLKEYLISPFSCISLYHHGTQHVILLANCH